MEAEAYFLQTRNGGHTEKGFCAQGPTRFHCEEYMCYYLQTILNNAGHLTSVL